LTNGKRRVFGPILVEIGLCNLVAMNQGRDSVAAYIAWSSLLVFLLSTWFLVLSEGMTWFSFHPLLQSLSIVFFTYGILTLQPTSQPTAKEAGLERHQFAILGLGVPCIFLGATAIAYNKSIHEKEHLTTWHGTFGYLALFWLIFQAVLGGGSVWYQGAAFGGGARAKSVWKYHRLSGYLLFPLLLLTAHLGGGWSDWANSQAGPSIRFLAFTLAPMLIIVSVISRIRLSKMKAVFLM